MDEVKVAIIVGHTEKEPGSVMNLTPTCTEYEYNSSVAKNISFLSEQYGIPVSIIYRDGIFLDGAYQKAVEFQADLVLELHFNSVESPEPEGAEILCTNAHKSHPVCEILLENMTKLFGGVNRGVIIPGVEDRGYHNIDRALPYFLLEPFFGSNPVQAKKAMDNVVPYAILILDSLKQLGSSSVE